MLKNKPGKQEGQIIRQAFRLALGRDPNKEETKKCLLHWRTITKSESNKKVGLKAFPTILKRTIMAEKTGEPYTFKEHMPAYQSYQPDLQWGAVDGRTRALAHVCLVLFNLNEFSYLY